MGEEAEAKAKAEAEAKAKEQASCIGKPECLGKSKNVCKRMMQQEGKCTWTGGFHGCAGSAECFGKSEGVCKRMMEKEGKCQWIPNPTTEVEPQVLPECSSLVGDKTDLRERNKFCWHLKRQEKSCENSFI